MISPLRTKMKDLINCCPMHGMVVAKIEVATCIISLLFKYLNPFEFGTQRLHHGSDFVLDVNPFGFESRRPHQIPLLNSTPKSNHVSIFI